MKLRIRPQLGWLVVGGLFLTACATAIQAAQSTPTLEARDESQITETQAIPIEDVATETGASPDPSPTYTPATERESVEVAPTKVETLPEEQVPRSWTTEFSTDFSIHSVLYSEILSGGPRKDGIPALDEPEVVSVDEADEWLAPLEPVIAIQVNEQVRAYPLQILTWHEITNDTLGGEPLSVTFCPLCNTGIAFKRTLGDQVLDFGTTGRLRNSNLVMYDRQTETWWQQASGEAIAGELTGTQLDFHPAPMIAWEEFKTNFPDGTVLSRETGYARQYGKNPYAGYDNINSSPFLFDSSKTPDELPPMARVLTVDLEDEAVAYPYQILEDVHVVNDKVAGQEIVVFWVAGTASALDSTVVAAGRDVGAASAFSSLVDGEALTFTYEGEGILDKDTGSEWNLLGLAVGGPLAGTQLEPVVSINHFWFSWAAFKPETRIYKP